MLRITLDLSAIAALNGLTEAADLCDEDGNSIGFFQPARLSDDAARSPTDTNELSLYDALVADGSIGCYDGPADLSTNPKHMEGFGQSGR